MSLKLKIGLIVAGLFLLHGIGDFVSHQFFLLPGFSTLEEEEARKDLSRVVKAIQREIYHIDSLCHDWSAWDDTYRFMETLSNEYIEANLVTSSFTDNRINLICYTDTSGKILWKGMWDYINGKPMSIKEFSVERFPPGHPLISYRFEKTSLSKAATTGVFMTRQGPLLVSSRPILNSNNQGPIRGSFIMGRFLGNDVLKALKDQTQLRFQAFPIPFNPESGDMNTVSVGESSDPDVVIEKKEDDILKASAVLTGIDDRSALKISADIPRRIASKGKTIALYSILSSLVAGLIAVILLYLALHRLVSRPLFTLMDHIFFVRKTGNLKKRLPMPGHHEISTLSREFDHLMERLENQRTELADLNLALQTSQDRLSGILNSVNDPIVVWDRSCRITWANQVAFEHFNRDLFGKTCNEVFSSENSFCSICRVKNCFQTETAHQFELTFMDKKGGGKEYWCTANVTVRDKGGSPESVMVMYHDITEKKRLKAETLRKSQLASIGEMAAGVAHEINNPVNGLINYAQILVNECPKDHLAYNIGLRMLKEGERIASIVKSLLMFARGNKSAKSVIQLPDVVSEVFLLIEAQLAKDGIRLEVLVEEDLPGVEANFQQIQQVLLNIVSNSRYALNLKYPGGHDDKRLSVTCKKVETGLQDGLRIVVEDTGAGMAADDLQKAMEPFFSTKPPGAGTGLGLSISYGIIADHGGKLRLESREGMFTRAIIDLPAGKESWEDYDS